MCLRVLVGRVLGFVLEIAAWELNLWPSQLFLYLVSVVLGQASLWAFWLWYLPAARR